MIKLNIKCVCIWCRLMSDMFPYPVKDPGFPGRGRQPIIWPFFSRELHENERNWTQDGGRRPWHPLDPSILSQYKKEKQFNFTNTFCYQGSEKCLTQCEGHSWEVAPYFEPSPNGVSFCYRNEDQMLFCKEDSSDAYYATDEGTSVHSFTTVVNPLTTGDVTHEIHIYVFPTLELSTFHVANIKEDFTLS